MEFLYLQMANSSIIAQFIHFFHVLRFKLFSIIKYWEYFTIFIQPLKVK